MSEEKETIETYYFENRDKWLEALSKAPDEKMIKTRSTGTGTHRYIPIEIQEAFADLFFRECDIIENEIGYVNGQIVCRIKLSVLPNYPNSEHRILAGIGAKVETSKKNSLEYGAASAQATAKSNALLNFGNMFGRNLNRPVPDGFTLIGKKKKE